MLHVIFNGEGFIAVGGAFTGAGAVTLKSIDGTTWTQVESPSSYLFHAVAHGSSTLVAAATHLSDRPAPALFTSAISSGSSSASGWTQRQGPNFSDGLNTGELIMVVGARSVSTTRAGVTWDQRELPSNQPVKGVASSGYSFVIVGEGGTIYSSADTTQWSARATTLGSRLSMTGVTHGDSGFIAVGVGGAIVTSPDGVAWTAQASGTTQHLSDVAWGPARGHR